jgi:hypothetical protein
VIFARSRPPNGTVPACLSFAQTAVTLEANDDVYERINRDCGGKDKNTLPFRSMPSPSNDDRSVNNHPKANVCHF